MPISGPTRALRRRVSRQIHARFPTSVCDGSSVMLIVSQGGHTACPQRSLIDYSQKGSPLLIAWDSWQGLEARHQRPFTASLTCSTYVWGVPPMANRVIRSLPFLDKEIKDQADCRQTLLNALSVHDTERSM